MRRPPLTSTEATGCHVTELAELFDPNEQMTPLPSSPFTCPLSPFIRLCRAEGIELAILFGSQAKGTVHATSDLDFAVAMEKGRNISKLRLIFDLEGIFHPRPVDLVILTPETPPLLLYEVFFKGRVLYESREGLFAEGRLKAWKLYLDSSRLRVRQAEYLREFVRRMKHVA